MLDKVIANAAEQIAVSPDQSQYTIQNQDVLPNNMAEQQAIVQPSVTTSAINNQLSDSPDWREYLSNPFRRNERKNMSFWAIEDMMDDPIYYATANKYGNELRQQGEIIYGAYRKANTWLGRLSDAYNVARYNLRASAARTELSNALQSGDEKAIAEAQALYDSEQRKIRTMGMKYDSDSWNSLMDFAASWGRNPELFLVGIGAGVLSGGVAPAVGTAIQIGSQVVQAGIVFADTYKLETGGALQQLDLEHPELPEEEKYKLASEAGTINAFLEAAPMVLGAGVTARNAASLRDITSKIVANSKLPKGVATSKAFLNALGDELRKKTVGGVFLDRMLDTSVDSVQELIQNAVTDAAVRTVEEKDRSVLGLTVEDLNEFLSAENPLDPKYKDKVDTLVNVGFASFLLGLPFGVVDVARSNRPQNVREKLQGVQANMSFLNGLRRWSQGAEVAKSSPQTITKKLQNEIKLGTVDSKIYLDKKQVLKLMESDADVAKALRNLGIEEALRESEENGGVVGVDFLKYEEQIIRGADDTLFQKIRDITSASPTNLSQAAFIEQLSTDQAAVEEIKRAREQPDSVYNQTYNQLLAIPGWDEKSAEAYAAMMQLATNRIGAFRLVSSTGEQVFQNIDLRMGYSNGAQIPLAPTTEQPATTPASTPAATTTGTTATTQPLTQPAQTTTEQGGPRPTNVPQTDMYSFEELDGTPSTYTKGGKIKQSTWNKIKALFTPEQLSEKTTIGDREVTFEDLLWGTVGNMPRTGSIPGRSVWLIARQHGVSPEQVYNAFAISRGQETKTFPADEGNFYTDDTIEVDGVKRSVYDASFNRIAWTEEELVAFWRWFGDSQATDVLGHPIPVVLNGNQTERFGTGVYYSEVDTHNVKSYGFLRVEKKAELPGDEFSEDDIQAAYEQDGVDGATDEQGLWVVRSEEQYREAPLSQNQTQAESTDNLGTQNPNDSRTLHQFVGEGANLEKEAPELAKRLNRAKELQAQGKSDEEIFNETHVHIGPDGKLRVQISDKDATIKNIKRRKDGRFPAVNVDRGMTLGDILDHPLLFALYPKLKNVPIQFKGKSSYVSLDPLTHEIKFINFRTSESGKSFRHSVLHEVQHAIQNMEGWARGGQAQGRQASGDMVWERWKLLQEVSAKLKEAKVLGYWIASSEGEYTTLEPDEFRAMQDSPAVKELEAKDEEFAKNVARLRELNTYLEHSDRTDARVRYFRLFGEAEARLTEKLANKSQQELDALDPYGYFDVSEFIIRDQSGRLIDTKNAPANTQTTGEFTITLNPEATEAVTGGKDEAGWFRKEGDKLVIGITPNANPTTLAHEIFHLFSVSMQQAFNSGEMTDYWKKQVQNLAKMVDAEFQTDPADPTVQRLFLTDKQEEKAANMFLQYIKEGKIKNREVAPLFAYMQQAFTRILRALGLTGKLSKESEELFDSLFRAQNDIEEEQKLAGLVAFEKPEGANQELYDFYVGAMLSSRAKASQNLVRKWYAIENFKKTKKYEEKKKMTYAAIYAQAQESMVYDILRTINDMGGDPAVALGVLTERYPDSNITLDFLQNLMETTPPIEQEVARLTEEKMEEYVRDEFKITDEELALRMSRNRDKVKALLAEGVLRSGGTMEDFEAAYKRANEAAEKQMQKTSIKRLLDKNYWNTLEARIVERYAYALANKDTNGIMEERYNQAVVNLIKIRAVGYESRVQKLVAFATKLRTNQKKDEYTAEAWDLLQSIVEKFGFKVTATRRSSAPLGEKLRQWIENQERTTFTTVGPLMNFLPMLQKGFDGTIMGMDVKMFDQLEAVLDTIDAIASKEFFLIGENEKAFLGEMANATDEHFEKKGLKPFNGDLKSSFFSKISRWRNPEPILKAIFPESVMLKVWYPLINAKAKVNQKEKQWIDRYREVRAQISLSSEKHTYSNGVQLSNAEVADLFLAMGTQHAYDNFCKKFGISAAQAEIVISEALANTPELEDFVKEVWAIYAESTDLLNDEYQKRNNKIFVKKEPRAFVINGIQFEGGYVPETKDRANTAMPWEPNSPSQEMGDIKNEKEIIKQADGDVKSIVDNMERTLMLFARQAYLPLAFNNAAKFMNNTNVRDTIGTQASAFIDDWMQTGFKSVPADTTGVARPIMSATTMAALGGRFMQGLVQLSGVIPAAIHVGTRNFLGAAMKALAHPKQFIKAIETARSKSTYMESRYEDPVSTLFGTSIGEQVSLEGGKTKWVIKSAQKLLMAYITYFDAIVSNITWDAAYAKAIDGGLSEEEARLEADSAVRITQTDSMQATRATALNSPLARALTPFSSYIMGMQSQAFALWTGNDKMKAVEFALGYIVISTLIESLAKEVGEGDDDDDKEYIERALNRWYNEIIGTTGSTIVPFANMGGVVGKKIAAGIERGITDDNEIFEKYGLSVPMIQYLDRIPTSAYNLTAGLTSGDSDYFVKSMTSASGLVSRGFEKQLKKMLED